ncbi:TIGR03619 family F420-dependent LLM class oxidoreductase [Yinghuangia sp. YIM S09857]|uniref:TIGR03619 family F420-dependent LLM class oxidoreductase n=1 Tax=Yinghuangia sp. YIM S09857 TaxID=3436929 RepID=UPI003F539493
MASIVPPGRLVYGMQLPIQTKSKSTAEAWEIDAGVEEMVAVARHAENTGFFYVGVCDHIGVPAGPEADHMSTTWYDCVATLGMLAGLTTSVRLLSNVYIPAYRHPFATAKAFMTLDNLSGGRVVLGVGAGHLRGEFDALGVTFEERGAITDEALDGIRAAFTEEFPKLAGPRFADGGMGLAPRPVQASIPIWIGGKARPALRRVALRGDGWIPQATPRAQMAEDIAYIRRVREEAGIIGALDIGFITEPVHIGTPSWDLGDSPVLSGSADSIAEHMRAMGEIGVNHLQIRFRNRSQSELEDQMSAWQTDVAPLLNP